jgi:endogenous inhibitor of DNA gyrase (YacG/DUF329 family)
MADLAQWLGGGYVVPGTPLDNEALEEASALDPSREPNA